MEWAETVRRSFRDRMGHEDPSVQNVRWYLGTVLGQQVQYTAAGGWRVTANVAADKVAATAFEALLEQAQPMQEVLQIQLMRGDNAVVAKVPVQL